MRKVPVLCFILRKEILWKDDWYKETFMVCPVYLGIYCRHSNDC